MEPLRPDDPPSMGSFRLRGRLGAGGMGRVYLAASPAGRAVAIKVIHPELAGDEMFRSRFRREVAAARQVSGAYTAPVVAAGLEGDPLWLATAFVAGPPLASAVAEQGPFPEATMWRLAAGLAEALGAVHAAGLIHRDLKPANVLLAEDGPRLIDFGIARALDGTAITASGHIVGTPAFMSPEQAEGRFTGPASDVFSLGSVLAYTASGTAPFGTDRPATILYRVVHAEPALDGIPAGLRELISSCLVKDPAGRPALPDLAAAVAAHWTPPEDGPLGPFWPETLAGLIRVHVAEAGAAAGPASPSVSREPREVRHSSSAPGTEERFSGGQPATAGGGTVTAQPAAAPGGPGTPAEPGVPWPTREDEGGKRGRRTGGPARRRVLLGLAGLVAAGAGVTGWELSRGGQPAASASGSHPGAQSRTSTRTSPGTGNGAAPRAVVLWSKTLGRAALTAPAVAAGVVYAGMAGGYLYARQAANGSTIWSYPAGGVKAGPVVAGGLVYVLTGVGTLHALGTDESPRWSFTGGDAPVSGFIVADGVVYAAADRTVYALRPADGSVAWSSLTSNTISTGLAKASGTVYAANNDNVVYAIRSGKQVWEHAVGQETDNLFGAQLAASGDRVYVGASDFHLYALRSSDGAPQWSFPTGNAVHGGPVVAGGVVYAGSSDEFVYAVSAATGRRLWRFHTGNEVVAAPVVAGSVVYVAGADKLVRALRATDGKELWQYTAGDSLQSSVAVAGNVVYAGTISGTLYALQAPAASA